MPEIKEYTTEEVEQLLKDSNKVLIDVREDEEVAAGMIEAAKHIPLGDIPDSVEGLDKDKEYIMVCRSGARSMRAAEFLDEKGFKVSNMKGGMLDWNGEVIAK